MSHSIELDGVFAKAFELFVVGSVVLCFFVAVAAIVYVYVLLWLFFDVLITRILKYMNLWKPLISFLLARARLEARKKRNK